MIFKVFVTIDVEGDKPGRLMAEVRCEGPLTTAGIIAACEQQAPALVELYESHYGKDHGHERADPAGSAEGG